MRRGEGKRNIRDLSCRLRCSLLLKARLQNWHLYFFSGARVDFLMVFADAAAGRTVMLAPGIVSGVDACASSLSSSQSDG